MPVVAAFGVWGHVEAMFLFNRFYSNKKIQSLVFVFLSYFCVVSVIVMRMRTTQIMTTMMILTMMMVMIVMISITMNKTT